MTDDNMSDEDINHEIQKLVRLKRAKQKKTWTPGKDVVQYAGPYFSDDEFIAGIECLLDGWLVLGEHGLKFERKFCHSLGKDFGALTNSGSSANLLMVSALRSERLYHLPPKTKIITPVAGFPTTVNPILQNDFEPVFVDIELDTLNLDLDQVELAAKNGAKVLIFAHVLSNPPNMDRLMDIVRTYDLILLEDCCDALGSTYDNQPLGSFGQLASCSFYPAHHITMGEGGFIACATKEQEMIIKSLREWGRGCYCSGQAASCLKNGMCKRRFSTWLPSLPDTIFDHKYVYQEIGYNLKPLEMQAAIGLVQLEKLDEIITLRKRNFSMLYDIFEPYQEIFHLPRTTPKADPAWFGFPLTLKDNLRFKRHEFTMYLEDHKIQTRNYFGGNLLLQPAYHHIYSGDAKADFPLATKVTQDTFFLGTSPVITIEQLEYVRTIVNQFFVRKP